MADGKRLVERRAIDGPAILHDIFGNLAERAAAGRLFADAFVL